MNSTYLGLHKFVSGNILYCAAYRSFASFVRFIPKYFFFFHAIINCILKTLSVQWIIALYRNIISFCILILCTGNSIHSSWSLCVCVCVWIPFRMSTWTITSSANKEFSSSLHIRCLYFFLVSVPWLESLILRVDILISFLILGDQHSVFHH